MTWKKWTEAEKSAAKDMRFSGASFGEIAIKLGRTEISVRRFLGKNRCKISEGIKDNAPNLWTPEQKEKARAMRAIGASFKEIAIETGKTRAAVSGFLKRNGLLLSKDSATKAKSNFNVRKVKIRPTIEDPPRDVPVPDGARHVPWIDLQVNECQWAVNGFWDGPSAEMPCCGLETVKGKRFCDYHETWARVKG